MARTRQSPIVDPNVLPKEDLPEEVPRTDDGQPVTEETEIPLVDARKLGALDAGSVKENQELKHAMRRIGRGEKQVAFNSDLAVAFYVIRDQWPNCMIYTKRIHPEVVEGFSAQPLSRFREAADLISHLQKNVHGKTDHDATYELNFQEAGMKRKKCEIRFPAYVPEFEPAPPPPPQQAAAPWGSVGAPPGWPTGYPYPPPPGWPVPPIAAPTIPAPPPGMGMGTGAPPVAAPPVQLIMPQPQAPMPAATNLGAGADHFLQLFHTFMAESRQKEAENRQAMKERDEMYERRFAMLLERIEKPGQPIAVAAPLAQAAPAAVVAAVAPQQPPTILEQLNAAAKTYEQLDKGRRVMASAMGLEMPDAGGAAAAAEIAEDHPMAPVKGITTQEIGGIPMVLRPDGQPHWGMTLAAAIPKLLPVANENYERFIKASEQKRQKELSDMAQAVELERQRQAIRQGIAAPRVPLTTAMPAPTSAPVGVAQPPVAPPAASPSAPTPSSDANGAVHSPSAADIMAVLAAQRQRPAASPSAS